MTSIKALGKYLDQPLLIKKLENKVPLILSVSGATVVTHSTIKSPKENRKNTFIQNSFAMTGAIVSALVAPKITNKIFKNNIKELEISDIIKQNTKVINKYVKKNKKTLSSDIKGILKKAKTKILSLKETDKLLEFSKDEQSKTLVNNLIATPENITSKEIFSEIGRLSLFGLLPVIGGIGGGTFGDKLTDRKWKEKFPDKIKEGTYQYLANIFLCNIGAGTALGIMEKMQVKSKPVRAAGMISGILLTGLVFGSAVANFIGEKLINPIFDKEGHKHEIYSSRKPEALDVCLHTDDIATVAVMSGLKWIEPALPILYAISGYRAGVGYRNTEGHHHHHRY